MQKTNPWLHMFSMLTVAATLCLIFIGGLVTTKDAGMSVPDWPTTFQYSMFTVPFHKWIGDEAIQSGVFYEHSHRLIASLIGVLTMVLAIWVWRMEARVWLKWLAFVAFLLVVAQGILGGLRVTHSSVILAMVHGCTAQAFLCVLVFITAALSSRWEKLPQLSGGTNLKGVCRTGWLLVGAVYIQLIVGAVMRHLKAGLAIPTFPKSGLNGEWIPPFWNQGIALHFTHRVGAVVVTLLAIALIFQIFMTASGKRSLTRPAGWLAVLVFVQISLGAHIILKLRPPTLTTLHVVTGATILATSFLIALRASRISMNAAENTSTEVLPGSMGRAAV